MPIRARHRVVVPDLGLQLRAVAISGAPHSGIIRRVRATINPADDPAALLGTGGATDIRIEIHEGGNPGLPATPLGGPAARSIPVSKALGAAPVGTTIDLGSGSPGDPALEVDYAVPPGQPLLVAAALDAEAVGGPDARLVATIVIEPHQP